MKVRQKWPAMRLLSHGLTLPAAMMGNRMMSEMTARKNAVCTLSIWVDSSRIMALVAVKMKPPVTSQMAPWTFGGRRRSQSSMPIAALDLALRTEVGTAVETVDQVHEPA